MVLPLWKKCAESKFGIQVDIEEKEEVVESEKWIKSGIWQRVSFPGFSLQAFIAC